MATVDVLPTLECTCSRLISCRSVCRQRLGHLLRCTGDISTSTITGGHLLPCSGDTSTGATKHASRCKRPTQVLANNVSNCLALLEGCQKKVFGVYFGFEKWQHSVGM